MVCRLAFVIVSVGTIAAVIYLSRNGTANIEYTVNGFVRCKLSNWPYRRENLKSKQDYRQDHLSIYHIKPS